MADDLRPTKWGGKETEQLKRLLKKGLNFRTIALQMDRTERSIANKVDELRHDGAKELPAPDRVVPWFKQQGLKIGFLDIETSNLEANAGFILSWCLKIRGEKEPRYALITENEIRNSTFDKRLMKELLKNLEDVDILVTYWGTGFDIPFMRTRALAHSLEFPAYGTIYHFDIFYAVRSLLKLHRNSLDAATRFLGIPGKTHLDMEQWFTARVGDPKTLKYVLEHNKQDVIILEKLFDRLEGFRKWTRRSI